MIFKLHFKKIKQTCIPQKKILQHNNNRFMMKELIKAIMLRSKLKKVFNEDKTQSNWQKYKHQQKFCLNLLSKIKNVADNQLFWK